MINKNTFYAGLQPCIRKILLVLLLCRVGTYFQSGLIGIKQYESYVTPGALSGHLVDFHNLAIPIIIILQLEVS